MCHREKQQLQHGMNFAHAPGVSIFLMSRRRNAPYDDALSEDGRELIYEGHDVPRTGRFDPKSLDQPWETTGGLPTRNAKFANAIIPGKAYPQIRVYEKLQVGILSDKGLFELTKAEHVQSGQRKVFKFHLRLADEQDASDSLRMAADRPMSRMIPSEVKQAVFKRDQGKCVICKSTDQLHFDHELPYSKGGTSFTEANVRILCARHNLEKGAKIQ